MTSGNTKGLTIAFVVKKPEIYLGNKIYTKIMFIPECDLCHIICRYQVLLSAYSKRDELPGRIWEYLFKTLGLIL